MDEPANYNSATYSYHPLLLIDRSLRYHGIHTPPINSICPLRPCYHFSFRMESHEVELLGKNDPAQDSSYPLADGRSGNATAKDKVVSLWSLWNILCSDYQRDERTNISLQAVLLEDISASRSATSEAPLMARDQASESEVD